MVTTKAVLLELKGIKLSLQPKIYADYHVHTSFSDDSDCPMEKMVQKGIELGIEEIAFTEHVDYGVKTDLNCNYEKYFSELHRMQEKYGDRIRIKKGIEFGIQTHTIDQFEQDFAKYDFDFVILSNHQIDNKEFWRQEFQQGRTQDEFNQAYYQAIYDVITKYKNYSVLGHLDMIKRYDKIGIYPDEKILPIVEKILKQVIADGKGIELNTSSFKYKMNDTMPSLGLLQLYRDLGGEIITLGSDAHRTNYLGCYIPEMKEYLRKIGFMSFCTFEKMHPYFHEF